MRSWLLRLALAAVVLSGLLALSGPAGLSSPEAVADNSCQDGVQASGALYRICLPDSWNGELVLWAHGYVNPADPLRIPDDQLPDGTPISDVINLLGFAYATTSYSKNGLAVKQGVADIVDLVSIFKAEHGEPDRVILTGASEGGIITALALEKHPDVFDGGVSACGPIGNFRKQIDYIGDFAVVFDYFFPGVVPASPTGVPQEVIDNWGSVYIPQVQQAIAADPQATEQLLRVTGAPHDPVDPSTIEQTVLGVLWYAVHATNDAIDTLGGQPFGNTNRIYRGSDNDLLLNLSVLRVQADPAALAEIQAHYETTGHLEDPMVTLHTTGDEIVPFWHQPRYRLKTLLSDDPSLHGTIRVDRYGHCNFTVGEAIWALLRLRLMMAQN